VGADRRVGTAEAARILGLSIPAVRKMVREGALVAETVRSMRGTPAYMITLPSGPRLSPAVTPPAVPVGAPSSSAREEGRSPMDSPTGAPSEQMIAAVIQASITPIVAPLTAAIDAYRLANERQVDQLITQAEQLGRLKAEMAALRTTRAARAPTARRQGSRGPEVTRAASVPLGGAQ